MDVLSFGTIYWTNPSTKKLEFLCAKKQGKGDIYSLFYHNEQNFSEKFYGDLLGLTGQFDDFNEILSKMDLPHYKNISTSKTEVFTVNYINLPYNPILLNALNGFKTYLSKCTIGGEIAQNCSKYPFSVYSDFLIVDVDVMKSMIVAKKFGSRDLTALLNFNDVVTILEKAHIPAIPVKLTDEQIFEEIRKKKYDISFGDNDLAFGANDSAYINQLQIDHATYINSLLPKYILSIQAYTGSMYTVINNYLRGKKWNPSLGVSEDTIKQHIDNINQALNNAPPTTKPLIVYRGMNFDITPKLYNLKVGDIVDYFRDSFNSCSFNINVSSNSFAGSQCCVYVVHLPAGIKGLYVNTNSLNPSENEFILAPGPLFRVWKFKHEKSPQIGYVSTILGYNNKPHLRYYRLRCEDCQQAYEKYNNIVYYQVVQPALAVIKTPIKDSISSPKHKAIDIHGKIIPQKGKYTKLKDYSTHKNLLKHSQFTITPPEFIKPSTQVAPQPQPQPQSQFGLPQPQFVLPQPQFVLPQPLPKPQPSMPSLGLNVSLGLDTLIRAENWFDPKLLKHLKLNQMDTFILELLIQDKDNDKKQFLYQNNYYYLHELEGVEKFISLVNKIFVNDSVTSPNQFLNYKPHTRKFLHRLIIQGGMQDLINYKTVTIDEFLLKYGQWINKLDQFIPQDSQIYQIFVKYEKISKYLNGVVVPLNYFVYYSYINDCGILGIQLFPILRAISSNLGNCGLSVFSENNRGCLFNPISKKVVDIGKNIVLLSFLLPVGDYIYSKSNALSLNISEQYKLNYVQKSFINLLLKPEHSSTTINNMTDMYNTSILPSTLSVLTLCKMILPITNLDPEFIDKIADVYGISGIIAYNAIIESHLKCSHNKTKNIFMNQWDSCVDESYNVNGVPIIKYLADSSSTQVQPQPTFQPLTIQPTSNIDPIHLKDLPTEIANQLIELSKGCKIKNTFKNPTTGKCVSIKSATGLLAITKLKNKLKLMGTPLLLSPTSIPPPIPTSQLPTPLLPTSPIPTLESHELMPTWLSLLPPEIVLLINQNFDSKYLKNFEGMTPDGIITIVKLTKGVTNKNTIHDKTTGNYIHINSNEGKEIIEKYKSLIIWWTVDIQNIDPFYLKNLPNYVIVELAKLTQNCPYNCFKAPLFANTCKLIDWSDGQKQIDYLIKTLPQPPKITSKMVINFLILSIENIDLKYLVNLSISVLVALANQTGCPKNHFRNPISKKCVAISNPNGKKLIEEMDISLNDITLELVYRLLPSLDKSVINDFYPITKEDLYNLIILTHGYSKNYLENPFTGLCVDINTYEGKLLFEQIRHGAVSALDNIIIANILNNSQPIPQELPQPIPKELPPISPEMPHNLPTNIDIKHLKNFTTQVITEIAKLAEGCPHNKIHNPHTGNCILIMSSHAKKVINEIIASIKK